MIPSSTYRLQMHAGFTLAQARAILPYLDSLGISHVYTSSLLTAKTGSTHGYDVIDHSRLNPEIGTDDELKAFSKELKARGMGLILDVVPNHMSVGGINAWWIDVLENGPSSLYANYFDIAWNDHYREALRGKVLLPILGSTYGEAIDSGLLKLTFTGGAFALKVYESLLPLDPRTSNLILEPVLEELKTGEASDDVLELQSIVTAVGHLPPRNEADPARVAVGRDEIAVVKRRLQALNLTDAITRQLEAIEQDPVRLDQLLDAQAYRPCFWRVASDEINYRRFFDINDLAAITTERPEVFDDVHRLIFEWVKDGIVDGLRIDHPDGLYDPRAYLDRLQEQSAGVTPLYVVVEKILGPREKLPESWATAGTTGYEFLNVVNGLFVDAASESAMTKTFIDFTGLTIPFDELVYRKKFLILQSSLTSELHVLAGHFDRLAQLDRSSRDFTLNGIRHALRELLCSFPIYRTYVDGMVRPEDAIIIKRAVRQARRRNPLLGRGIFDFLRDTLLLKDPASGPATEDFRAAQIKCTAKFQQLSAPVMAKGFEDTSLYIYNRLVSLNEVGGEPKAYGREPAEVHQFMAERPRGGMSPMATHDTKRSEGVRARINVLSEFPDEWAAAVARWRDRNEKHRQQFDDDADAEAPDRNEEYLLYQTLVGTWPLEGIDDVYRTRIRDYMTKVMQEAKVHSSWINPDAEYLAAVGEFVNRVLGSVEFISDVHEFVQSIAPFGFMNSLAQTLIRGTSPGVPDTYQGTEFWDFHLVDPDNRGEVDFDRRIAVLKAIDGQSLDGWKLLGDETFKMKVVSRMLRLRRELPDLFRDGDYLPLEVEGDAAANVFAYLRTHGETACLIVVPRCTGHMEPGPQAWKNTFVKLPAAWQNRQWQDALRPADSSPHADRIAMSTLFAHAPVAMFLTAAANKM